MALNFIVGSGYSFKLLQAIHSKFSIFIPISVVYSWKLMNMMKIVFKRLPWRKFQCINWAGGDDDADDDEVNKAAHKYRVYGEDKNIWMATVSSPFITNHWLKCWLFYGVCDNNVFYWKYLQNLSIVWWSFLCHTYILIYFIHVSSFIGVDGLKWRPSSENHKPRLTTFGRAENISRSFRENVEEKTKHLILLWFVSYTWIAELCSTWESTLMPRKSIGIC